MDLPKRSICDLPAYVAMGFVHVLDATTNFEGAVFGDIVDRLSVNDPRDDGDEILDRLVRARRIDVIVYFGRWKSCTLRVVSNDSRLIDIVMYKPTAVGNYGADPVISVLLSWCRWVRLDNY